MHNGLAESGFCGRFFVDMDRVVIAGKVGKQLDVFGRDGTVDDVGLTNFEGVVGIRITLHAGRNMGFWVGSREATC